MFAPVSHVGALKASSKIRTGLGAAVQIQASLKLCHPTRIKLWSSSPLSRCIDVPARYAYTHSASSDLLHGQKRDRFHYRVNRYDVFVCHCRRQAGFSQKPFSRRRCRGKFGVHQFDCYNSVQLFVKGFGYHPERFSSSNLFDFVSSYLLHHICRDLVPNRNHYREAHPLVRPVGRSTEGLNLAGLWKPFPDKSNCLSRLASAWEMNKRHNFCKETASPVYFRGINASFADTIEELIAVRSVRASRMTGKKSRNRKV